MTTLGMTTLQVRIEDYKFLHTFIVCDRLCRMELPFDIGVQKKHSQSYVWDKEKNCYMQMDGKFLTYTKNCELKTDIAFVK